MDHEDLRLWSKRAADWAADYHRDLRDRPVRAPLVPGAIARQVPVGPPDSPSSRPRHPSARSRIVRTADSVAFVAESWIVPTNPWGSPTA